MLFPLCDIIIAKKPAFAVSLIQIISLFAASMENRQLLLENRAHLAFHDWNKWNFASTVPFAFIHP
jgi:hypothetical protein